MAAAIANEGFSVGVLDADIWGFSQPTMLGIDGRLTGENQKIVPHEKVVGKGKLKVVSMGFLVDDNESALMWRGLILAKAVEQFLTDVQWGELDYLLVDMPPGTGDIQMALARLVPQSEMLVVTTSVARRTTSCCTRGRYGATKFYAHCWCCRKHECVCFA